MSPSNLLAATILLARIGRWQPKQLGFHELWQEMQAMARVIGPRQRVVCLVRSHHIYGFLFGVLLPRVWGGVPVLHLPGEQLARLPAQVRPGDLVVGYPEGWAALARLVPQWPDDVVGVTSTAPWWPTTWRGWCSNCTTVARTKRAASRCLASVLACAAWRLST